MRFFNIRFNRLFRILGLRSQPRHYAYALENIGEGEGIYAHWLHPKVKKKTKTIINAVFDYQRILKTGDFCIDIGAQTGDTTLPMALAVGKEGCVLALEPNPYSYHVLEKNARANRHITTIYTMMAAAGPHPGFMEFEYSDAGFCNGGRHEGISVWRHGNAYKLKVFCVNLEQELRDDFSDVLPRLRFIKVDTEGYDLSVLRSLANVIRDYRPIVKAEVYKQTDSLYRRDILSFFLTRGYSVFRMDAEPAGCGPRLTENMLEERKHYDILCFPNMDTSIGNESQDGPGTVSTSSTD